MDAWVCMCVVWVVDTLFPPKTTNREAAAAGGVHPEEPRLGEGARAHAQDEEEGRDPGARLGLLGWITACTRTVRRPLHPTHSTHQQITIIITTPGAVGLRLPVRHGGVPTPQAREGRLDLDGRGAARRGAARLGGSCGTTVWDLGLGLGFGLYGRLEKKDGAGAARLGMYHSFGRFRRSVCVDEHPRPTTTKQQQASFGRTDQ